MFGKKIHFKIGYLLMCSILVLQSCGKGEERAAVDSQLQVFFEEFSTEAQIRGLEIDLTEMDVSGFFDNIEDQLTMGQCKQYDDDSKEVVIDADHWNKLSSTEKEYLVFHELGHCVLGREHLNTKDDRGNCVSIMQSGEGGCRDNYSTNKRTDYLDELFDN